jgi:hypothetical protein
MISRIFAAVLFALLTVTAPAHSATLRWDVDAHDASGRPNRTVTGFFDYNSVLGQITNFNIAVAQFPTFTLNPTNAQVSIGNALILGPQTTNIEFRNFALSETVFLQTAFLADFGQSNPRGYELDFFSDASSPDGGFNLQGGLELATPLPAALPLFGSGMIALAGFAAYRSRRAALRG